MFTVEQLKRLKQINVSKDGEKTKIRVKTDFTAASNKVKTQIVDMSGQKRSAYYRVFKTGAMNARLLLPMAAALNVTPFYYTGEVDKKAPCGIDQVITFLKAYGYKALADDIAGTNTPKQRKPRTGRLKTQEILGYQSDPPPAEDAGEDKDVSTVKSEASDDVFPLPDFLKRRNRDRAHNTASDKSQGKIKEIRERLTKDDFNGIEWHHVDDHHVLNPGISTEATTLFEFALPDSEKFRQAVEKLSEEDAVLLLRSLFRRSAAGGGEAEQYIDLVKRFLLI